MSIKRKTSRRLLLLGVVGVLVVGGAAGLFVVRRIQRARFIESQRHTGLELSSQGRHYEALTPLSKFLERNPNDLEALRAYATSREHVEEPDGAHIIQAARHYQHIVDLQPDDRELSLHLLELFGTAGLNTEAIDLAQRLRPSNLSEAGNDDLRVLRAEGAARSRAQGRDPATSEVLDRVLELDPGDFGTRVVYAQWLRDSGRRDEAANLAREFSAAHPRDPRADLLEALVRTGDPGFDAHGATFAALCGMNGLDPVSAGPTHPVTYTDAVEVLRNATMFDGLNAHAHALAVLSAGAAQVKDGSLDRLVTRRMWMSDRPREVLRMTDAAAQQPASVHTEVLVFRMLAQRDLGDLAAARATADLISARIGDFRAGAWKLAFPALLSDPSLPTEGQVTALAAAVKKFPHEPVLQTLLGDALRTAGRTSDARDAWKLAGDMTTASGWTGPWLRIAYSYLADNRPQSALAPAKKAAEIAPRATAPYVCLLRANSALLLAGYNTGLNPPAESLLDVTDRLNTEMALSQDPSAAAFRRDVLPGRVLLTAHVRGPEAAREVLDNALSEFPSLPTATIQELLDISAGNGLQAETVLLARLNADGSGGSIPAAFAIARARVRAGDSQSGHAVLEAGLAGAKPAEKAEWRAAIATLLEVEGKPAEAAAAWAAACDDSPNDLPLTLRALSSNAVCSDRALTERLIARATTLGNYEPTRLPSPVLYARARALLSPPLTEANRNAAVESLRTLIAGEPDWIEARTLLVSGLLMEDADAGILPLPREATEHITALIPLVPDPAPLKIRLAQMQAQRGEAGLAKAQLEGIASSAQTSPQLRLQAIDTLISMRELAPAADALEKLDAVLAPGSSPDARVRLASVYRSLSRDEEALRILRALAQQPLGSPEYVVAVASDLAGLHDLPLAQRVLRELDTLPLPPGAREMHLARYTSRYGDRAETRSLLERAAELDHKNAQAWTRLISYLSEQGMNSDAAAALERARAALPGHPRIAVLEKQMALATAAQAGILDLDAIAVVLDAQPDMKARAKGVREVAAARAGNLLSDDAQVERISRANAAEPVVQTLLAQVLMQESPARPQQAMDVMRRTLREHPRSVEAAMYATSLFRTTQHWADMLTSARAWQELTRDRDADIAAAEALIALSRPDAALESLQRHTASAAASPDDEHSQRVLGLTARALVADKRESEALSLLTPLFSSSAVRTRVFLPLAGQFAPDDAAGTAWIASVQPSVDRSSTEEVLAVAAAHATLARRFPATAAPHLAQALTLVSPLAAPADAPAGVLEAHGTILAMQGDGAAAAASFRRALQSDPRSVHSLRSLSGIIGTQNAAEGVRLAESALAITGPRDPDSQDALGRAYRSLAATQRGTEAAQSLEKAAAAYAALADVQPTNASALIGAIASLDGADKPAATLPFYERLLALPQLPQGVTRASIQNNFADAIVRSGRVGEELSRARNMARQATQAEPSAASFDTLASVELAMGDRDEAAAHFRRALELDAGMLSSMVGLAECLVQGGAPEREEATQLMEQFAKHQGVPPSLQDRAQAVREKLR